MTTADPRTEAAAFAGSATGFPTGFRWGVATAAYQIEGAAHEDGRGPSIWDTFSHTPGRVADGDTGDVACDHYHRFESDVELLAGMGVNAYRFSIAWPRIQPEGRGAPNPKGLAFYERLVDRLLSFDIEPVVTLYHWDLPQALEDRGGWVDRDTAGRFADYAEIVHARLGDRVATWTTLNEPWCSALLGYGAGIHAPGIADPGEALVATHHLLLAHGLAVDAMRAGAHADWSNRMGVTLNVAHVEPATDAEPDIEAARRIDGLQNRLYLDPVLLGRYPGDLDVLWSDTGADAAVRDGDLAQIAQPLDVLGLNYYTRHVVRRTEPPAEPKPSPWICSPDVAFDPPAGPTTAMGWEIHPEGLTALLVRVHAQYPEVPLMVTENGAAFDDDVTADGRIPDHDRIAFLASHIRACEDAIASGVPLEGYFAWSFMDNFEWAEGYRKRFGIVHVDYETQARTVKDSGWWYAQIARNGGLT
jgi:beta-glucosidase